jgi:histidinol-phosphate aminotransferase
VSPLEPREGLRDVSVYQAPQLDVPARLNTNECPHPMPQDFFEDMARAVRDLPVHRYPDREATRLREELAELAGHDPAGTWAANGSNELIQQLLLAYAGPGRRVVLFEPTYSMYPRFVWLTHSEPVIVCLEEPWRLDSEAMEAAADAEPHVVFACSPNNPTGNAQPVEAIDELARAVPDALVLVDEAYIEFGGETALPLVSTHPNVVIVRTFSKAFAMAGARIGYCFATERVVEDLRRVRLPYHLSALTQAVGIAALHHRTEALAILDAVRAERDRILENLRRLPGVTAYPSDANFVLFRPPGDAKETWQRLLDRGVLVRDLSDVVDGCLRVTAGTEHEVDRFLGAMEEIVG